MIRNRLLSLLFCLTLVHAELSSSDDRVPGYPFDKDAETGRVLLQAPAPLTVFSESDRLKSRSLSLYELSNAMTKLAEDHGLKIVSQRHGPVSSEYNVQSATGDRYLVNVNGFKDQFEMVVSDQDTGVQRRSIVPNRSYMVNEFRTFVGRTISSLGKRDRKLYENADPRLESFCEGLVKVLESKRQFQQGFIREEDADRCSVKLNSLNVFEVHVKRGSQKTELIISNLPYNGKFQHFASNHFEHRYGVKEEDTADQLKDYFERISGEVLEKIRQAFSDSDNVRTIYTMVVEKLMNLYALVDLEDNKATLGRYTTLQVGRKDSEKVFKIAEIKIYPSTPGVTYNIELLLLGQTIQFGIINTNLAASVTNTLSEILTSLDQAVLPYYSLQDIDRSVEELLKNRDCNKGKSIDNLGTFNVMSYELFDGDSPSCKLKGSILSFYIINPAMIESLHLTLNNDLLKDEFVIPLDQNFEVSLEAAVTSFINVVTDVTQARQNESEVKTVDFNSLCGYVSDKLAPNKCEAKDNGQMFECSNEAAGNTPVLMLYNAPAGSKLGYFKATFLSSNHDLLGSRTTTKPKETNIPMTENSDVVASFMADLDRFFQKQT